MKSFGDSLSESETVEFFYQGEYQKAFGEVLAYTLSTLQSCAQETGQCLSTSRNRWCAPSAANANRATLGNGTELPRFGKSNPHEISHRDAEENNYVQVLKDGSLPLSACGTGRGMASMRK